jgi:hypothetical protein
MMGPTVNVRSIIVYIELMYFSLRELYGLEQLIYTILQKCLTAWLYVFKTVTPTFLAITVCIFSLRIAITVIYSPSRTYRPF